MILAIWGHVLITQRGSLYYHPGKNLPQLHLRKWPLIFQPYQPFHSPPPQKKKKQMVPVMKICCKKKPFNIKGVLQLANGEMVGGFSPFQPTPEFSPRLGNSESKESKIFDQSPGVFCQAPRGLWFFFVGWRWGLNGLIWVLNQKYGW